MRRIRRRGFGQMPQTDEEMVEFEMRSTNNRRAPVHAWEREERERHFREFPEKTYKDEHGCHRWKSNNQYPPDEVLTDAGISREERRRCGMLRMAQSAKFMEEYRRARRGRPRSAEEMFEMQAAFGPGETVVDVITGERIKLPGRRRR